MKDAYIAAHEELIAEFLERHPHISEAEAYDITADAAYDRMVENLADIGDNYEK